MAPRVSFGWRNFHGPRGGNGGFTSVLAESSNRFMVWFYFCFWRGEAKKKNREGVAEGPQKCGFNKSRIRVHGTWDNEGYIEVFGRPCSGQTERLKLTRTFCCENTNLLSAYLPCFTHTCDWKRVSGISRNTRGRPVLVATSTVLISPTIPPADVESLPSTYLRIKVHHGREGRDHAISSGHKVSGAKLGKAAQKER